MQGTSVSPLESEESTLLGSGLRLLRSLLCLKKKEVSKKGMPLPYPKSPKDDSPQILETPN